MKYVKEDIFLSIPCDYFIITVYDFFISSKAILFW